MLKKIRQYFITGLLILTPLALTWWLIWKLFLVVDEFLSKYLTSWLDTLGIPYIRGYGFVAVVLIILITGIVARNYFGKKVFSFTEYVVKKIPFINRIYEAIQQISNTFLTRNKRLFTKTVLIEYPKKDSFVLGFVTREADGEIRENIREDSYSIFIPTTPNPTSGFLLFIPKREAVVLDLSIEEAVKLIMSGGMVTPDTVVELKTDPEKTSVLEALKSRK